ncbi:hypothetical protein A7G45_31350 [Mycolicibacterium llatzerense]|nr:hypothetical protein [Mycolicibacterium llatzerense]
MYAVVNTQRRAQARNLASEYLARSKALAAPEVQADQELKDTGTRELASARDQLEKALRRAYQHIAFVAQPDPDGERYLDQHSFDDDSLTALNGTMVWKALADRDKVFDKGQFGAKALLHNLRDQDYGKTLSDLRAAFYSAPRLPLLYGGDQDLQQAVFDAVNAGDLAIVDAAGTAVAVTAPGQINLTSAGLRIARPTPPDCATCGQPAHRGACTNTTAASTGTTTAAASGGQTSSPANTSGATTTAAGGAPAGGGAAATTNGGSGAATTSTAEKSVAFSFTSSMLSAGDTADGFATLFRSLYVALDERKISYMQGTLNIVVDAEVAGDLAPLLSDLGLTATVRDI